MVDLLGHTVPERELLNIGPFVQALGPFFLENGLSQIYRLTHPVQSGYSPLLFDHGKRGPTNAETTAVNYLDSDDMGADGLVANHRSSR